MDYLKSQGVEFIFGGGHTEEEFRQIARQLDNMYKSINLNSGYPDQVKLNFILKYMLENYSYGAFLKVLDTDFYFIDPSAVAHKKHNFEDEEIFYDILARTI